VEEPWAKTLAVGVGLSVGMGESAAIIDDGGSFTSGAGMVDPVRVRASWLAASWLALELETGYSHAIIGYFVPMLASSLGFRFGKMRRPGERFSGLFSLGYDVGWMRASDSQVDRNYWAFATGARVGLNLGVRLLADRRRTLTASIGGQVGGLGSDEVWERSRRGGPFWVACVVGLAWDWWLL